jgi:DNA-binding response OmpR family regulator
MPGLDGTGLCKRVRGNAATADLPIIMLTAKGYELSHREICEQLGVLAILAKPFSPRTLLCKVDEVCGRTESGSSKSLDGVRDPVINCQESAIR